MSTTTETLTMWICTAGHANIEGPNCRACGEQFLTEVDGVEALQAEVERRVANAVAQLTDIFPDVWVDEDDDVEELLWGAVSGVACWTDAMPNGVVFAERDGDTILLSGWCGLYGDDGETLVEVDTRPIAVEIPEALR